MKLEAPTILLAVSWGSSQKIESNENNYSLDQQLKLGQEFMDEYDETFTALAK